MSSRVVNFILKGESYMTIVKSSETEFTYESYLDAISKTAGPDECYYFANEDGSLIPPELFIPLVNQNFVRGNDKVFVGSIRTENDSPSVELADNVLVDEIDTVHIPSASSFSVTTSENLLAEAVQSKEFELDVADLRRFIIENEGEYLLKNYSTNSSLSDPHRKALVALIVRKLTTQHSYWPSTSQKVKFAKLAVELFPIYRTQSANYYELFFDPVKQKGFINSRLKTVQKNIRETTGQRKQSKKRSTSPSDSANSSKEPRLSEVVDTAALKTQFKDDIEFLINCPSSETSAISERMKRTFTLRKEYIHAGQISALWTTFPCYLTTPNIDYELCTGHTKTNCKVGELVSQIFRKYSVLKSKRTNEPEGVDDEWDSFTNAMLTLLKLLPSFRKSINKKGKDGSIAPIIQNKAKNVCEKIIVFVKSNNPIDTSSISELPVLVAVGPVKKTILQYFLKIDGKLLPVKENCTSIEAFDYLYKAHRVFNYSFDWELLTFCEFLRYFIYEEHEGIVLTTRQKEIWKFIST